jgi:hypothetical protein
MLRKLIKLASNLESMKLQREANFLYSMIKEASYQDRMMEERNYMMDSRTNAKNAWEGYDERSNTITVSWTKYDEEHDTEEDEVLKLPAKLEICDLCGGKGKVVNPSIDAGGLSQDDFYDDPDFEEEYFGGTYDIGCPQCSGKRVVPVVNYDGLNPEEKKEFDEYQREQAEIAEEEYNDRRTRMGEMGMY